MVATACFAVTISELTPIHPRPFLLPESNKQRLLKLIENKDWAKQNFNDLKQKAETGDGYSAAFLFVLTNDEHYLELAKSGLLKIGNQGGDLGDRALNANDAFFEQGMPWLGDVFYRTNSKYLEAFDLIYEGLSQPEKAVILKGINASADFRQQSMDTWWQTANLVFKPTSMVAIAGLVTQDPKYLNWGFFRKPESNLGGYFSALNNMLKDNGPWHEAPIYAITHLPLYQSLKISDLLSTMTGADWFNRKLLNGSSIRGLMDYYINTTYPREIRPDGSHNYRLLTYGDGATGQRGDTYLVAQNPLQHNLAKELSLAFKLSRDPGYAAFLKLVNDYQPNLIDQPELPVSPLPPLAKSSIWSDFGLAFLRSDHSRNYWKNPDAIATSLMFRQGYGHGHADALSMTVFGAGQLFYPDYNAIQYENPAIGWTGSSVAHNTVVVDGNNSSNPKDVKIIHEFNKDFRFVQADVAEPLGLIKKRTLALTNDYLLDVFHIDSLIPRTYDYLLHSFGRIETNDSNIYKSQTPFSTRYKNIKNFKSFNHDEEWEVDFVIDLDKKKQNTNRIISQFIDQNNNQEKVSRDFGFSSTDSFRAARLNFRLSGGGNTTVGIGEDEYGLSFLAARREGIKQTTFITMHSPSYLDQKQDTTNKIETLVDSKAGVLIKATTDTYIDIHTISHQPANIMLHDPTSQTTISFKNYALIRVNQKTKEITTHGNLDGYFIPAAIAKTDNDISHGEFNAKNPIDEISEHLPIQVNTFPDLIVLKDFSDSEFTISLTNKTDSPISANLELATNANYDIPVKKILLPAIPAYRTVHQKVILGRYKQASGADILPLKITINNTDEIINHGIMASAGPSLMRQFEEPDDPVYRIVTFDSTFDFSMRDGLIRQVSTENQSLFTGKNLFAFSDGKTIFSAKKNTIETSYTWANEANSSLISEINNLIRWHLFTIQNRFYIKLDSVYTRLDEVFFIFDKTGDKFDWQNAAFLNKDKQARLLKSKLKNITTNAIEIPFKNTSYSLCIKTTEIKNWNNSNKDLSFSLSRSDNDQFGFGICPKNSLATWAH